MRKMSRLLPMLVGLQLETLTLVPPKPATRRNTPMNSVLDSRGRPPWATSMGDGCMGVLHRALVAAVKYPLPSRLKARTMVPRDGTGPQGSRHGLFLGFRFTSQEFGAHSATYPTCNMWVSQCSPGFPFSATQNHSNGETTHVCHTILCILPRKLLSSLGRHIKPFR